MFINFSNHPSTKWGTEQLAAAKEYGEVVDMAFPNVNPSASTQQIHELAKSYVDKMLEMQPACVLCQGEFCICFAVISELKKNGIKVVAACSERKVEEKKVGNDTEKVSYFSFVQFREY